MAVVPRLVSLFESIESTSSSTRFKRTRRPSNLGNDLHNRSSLSNLCLSIQTAFQDNRHFSISSPISRTASPSTSVTSSPSSSVRASKRYSRTYSPMSCYSTLSYSSRSPCLLKRQPSAIDLELQDEKYCS